MVVKPESEAYYKGNKELYSYYQKITPLGRMAEAKDIAELAFFLCSERASFITGQNIVIDGGLSLQGHDYLVRKMKAEL